VDTIVLVFKPLFCYKSCTELRVELQYLLVPARCWISMRSSFAQMRVFVNAMSSHEESIARP